MWLLLAASLCLLTPATRLGRRGGACLLTASDPSLSKEGAGAPDSARSGARGQRADRGRRRQRQRQPYLAHALKAEDRMSYKAAGLLGYRVDASGAVHVLLARQAREARSRNVQGHMAKVRVGTWNLLGGRRWKLELSALVTAAREVEEETGGALSEEHTMKLLRDERTHALFLPDSSYAVFVAPMCAAAADAATGATGATGGGGGGGDTGVAGDGGDGTGLCRLPVSEAFAISEGDGVNALQWVPWEEVRRACPSRRRRGLYKEPVPLNEHELLHPFLVAAVSNGLIGAHLRRAGGATGATPGDKTVVEKCTDKITDAISPAELEIQGAFDDPNGSHISIYCVAEAFEGMRSMTRQQMVYKAIREEMQDGGPLHAVDSMTLLAPSEKPA